MWVTLIWDLLKMVSSCWGISGTKTEPAFVLIKKHSVGSLQAMAGSDSSSPCCEVTNVRYPAQPDGWDYVASLHCLLCEKSVGWIKTLSPFHQVLAPVW